MAKLVITQVKSSNGSSRKQRETLKTLGLGQDRPHRRARGPSDRARPDPRGQHLVKVRWLSRAHRPALAEARPGLAQAERKRVGRGEGSGTGKTSGRGHKGAGARSGKKRRGALRGRPDADPHADAQAARPAHEEVDAVREVPHAHPAGQPARPRGALRRRRRGHPRRPAREGPRHAPRGAGQDPRPGASSPRRSPCTPTASRRPPARRSRPRAAPAS